MAPELVVDPDVPPPARLSGYLLHTPRRELSGALFAAATLVLAVIGLRDFPLITEAVSDRLLLAHLGRLDRLARDVLPLFA